MNTKQLRDEAGKFLCDACPNPLCGGKLKHVSENYFECDGLVDPDHPDMELTACTEYRYSGAQHVF